MADDALPSAPRAEAVLGPGWGWRVFDCGPARVTWRGYLFDGARTLEGHAAAERVAQIVAGCEPNDEGLKRALGRLAGHFAFVLADRARTIACVDRIRSAPLLWGRRGDDVLIDDRAPRLAERLGTGGKIDHAQALALAMSGYTIGAGTIFEGVHGLRAGEALAVDRDGARTLRWFVYDAWHTEAIANPERRLSELHRFVIERLAKSADGRTIAVPLSAGLDSRMIASGLKAAGYPHVRLFSYGRPGNHEASTARTIAERLGYPWTFVPFSPESQQRMFADADHARMWREADCGTSAPFEQDWAAIGGLKASGFIPADAILVNGNSGDYITGAHAPVPLIDTVAPADEDARRERVLSAVVKKHFRLWEALATPGNDAAIKALLAREAADAGADFGVGQALAGVHEMLEYQDRQSKYVVSGQRTYEWFGLEWRLPLWDDEIVAFFRNAPMDLKCGQNLYKRVLTADNWGGVWRDVPVNAKTIRPRWIVPLRLVAKAVYAPLGPEAWHRFERRAFVWWTDPLSVSAIVPYAQALADRRGARHSVAWIADAYLARHGVTQAHLSSTA